jgi:DNA repair exonuclease SbcCD ATPase subunit
MAEPTWIPLRQYAEAKGVTADAVLKAIKRGRLGLPHRRSNADGRGSFEVLVDLAELPTALPAEPVVPDRSPTVGDRSATEDHPLQAEIEAVRAHLAAVEAERDRLQAERDQERGRLEQARQDHAAEARRLQAQLDGFAARLADLAKDAHRAGAAEAELVNTRAEMDRMRRRGWLARLLNLGG